jgi:hypothetical protein
MNAIRNAVVIAHSLKTRCLTFRNEGWKNPTGVGFDSNGLPSAAGPPTSGTQSFFLRDRNSIVAGFFDIRKAESHTNKAVESRGG